ncbi:WD40 repeat domain-containing protein [Planctomycetota bacterium]
MIFDLASDFAAALSALPQDHPKRRLLSLLEEAIRRDIHFIDRHPTTLFQCMWNSCWWYDCPDAYRFLDLSAAGTGDSGDGCCAGLRDCVQDWRAQKRPLASGPAWLRSRLPSADRLGSGLRWANTARVRPVSELWHVPSSSQLVAVPATRLLGKETPLGADAIAVFCARTTSLIRCLTHGSVVRAADISPDGRHIVSLSGAKTITLWEASSGRELRRFAARSWNNMCVAMSPACDQVAVGAVDNTITIHDLETGLPTATLLGHKDTISSVRYSSDGRYLVSSSRREGECRLWDVAGACSVYSGPDTPVDRWQDQRLHDLFHRWDKYAFLIVADQIVLTDDLHPGQPEDARPLKSGSLAISPRTCRAAVALGSSVLVFDTETGELVRRLELKGLEQLSASPIDSIALFPDSPRVAIACCDRSLRIFDLSASVELGRHSAGHDPLSCVLVSPDGRAVCGASTQGTVRVFDARIRGEPVNLKKCYTGIRAMRYSPDGSELCVGFDWHETTGHAVAFLVASSLDVRCFAFEGWGSKCMAFSADGKRLFAGVGRSILEYDSRTGEEVSSYFVPDGRQGAHNGAVTCLDVRPDGDAVVSGGVDHVLRLWDAKIRARTDQELTVLGCHERAVNAVRYSPDGRYTISGDQAGVVCLCDPGTGELVSSLKAHRAPVLDVGFSPDARTVFSASATETRVFNIATGMLERRVGDRVNVAELSQQPARSALASVLREDEVAVVEVDTGRAVAFFPGQFLEIVRRPGCLEWAGAVGLWKESGRLESSNLSVVALEAFV